jgi:fluoroacetyl-CoA thioesterase
MEVEQMPVDESAIGSEGVVVARVDENLTADRYGNEGLEVLATPALVGLFEQAAMRALDGLLDPGEASVGSLVEITHLAPTPAGAEVTVRARLTRIDGREAWFELEAEDDRETVARGRHSRVVIERARFERLVARKRG